jgi:hypothetical protein
VLDYEKAVEQLECHRQRREKVERHNHLAVILEERQPALSRVTAAPHAAEIPRHTPLRDDQTELLKFTVDLRGSPTLVSLRQSTDQSGISSVIFGRPPSGRDRQRQ